MVSPSCVIARSGATRQPSGMSLRGAKRRGNLTQGLTGDCHGRRSRPRNDRKGPPCSKGCARRRVSKRNRRAAAALSAEMSWRVAPEGMECHVFGNPSGQPVADHLPQGELPRRGKRRWPGPLLRGGFGCGARDCHGRSSAVTLPLRVKKSTGALQYAGGAI